MDEMQARKAQAHNSTSGNTCHNTELETEENNSEGKDDHPSGGTHRNAGQEENYVETWGNRAQNHAGPDEGANRAPIQDVVKVPRPKGQPGTDWSIAIEMGLAGSTKKKQKYNLLLVSRH
jgi:hypothetical protein